MLMNVAKSCLERERPNIGGVRSLITSSIPHTTAHMKSQLDLVLSGMPVTASGLCTQL